MTYLFIFLGLAMVIAPLMAFKPSKTVKRQMAFRERAIALGLQVKVADLPQSHRDKVRREAIEQGVVYRLPFIRRQSLAHINRQCCVNTEQGLEWSGQVEDVVKVLFEAQFQQLTEDTVALELSSVGVGVYWREQGTIERVEQLHQVLDSLRARLNDYYGVANGSD